MDRKQVSWKKSIKYLQILFFIFIVLWYNIYNYTIWVYTAYNVKVHKLQSLKSTLKSINSDITKVKSITELLKKINKYKSYFINAYSICYPNYTLKKYNIWHWHIVSLKDCINAKYKKSSISMFKDVDLENIWILFWIYQDKSDKMNFDQKRFLLSLDYNIFWDRLEKKVPLLSFSNPVLINKELWLYKVSFTFTTSLSYEELKNIFNRMQNLLYKNNNIYYTISNIWKFDIMNESEEQKINIQWSFYFSR